MPDLACPENPDLPGHVVEILGPGPDGWTVRCIPHGNFGPWTTHLAAFTAACIHDDDVSPWALKGWA